MLLSTNGSARGARTLVLRTRMVCVSHIFVLQIPALVLDSINVPCACMVSACIALVLSILGSTHGAPTLMLCTLMVCDSHLFV